MSDTTLELYNALVEAGIEKNRAERVAELVIIKAFCRKSESLGIPIFLEF